jgi:hypothetical protein
VTNLTIPRSAPVIQIFRNSISKRVYFIYSVPFVKNLPVVVGKVAVAGAAVATNIFNNTIKLKLAAKDLVVLK